MAGVGTATGLAVGVLLALPYMLVVRYAWRSIAWVMVTPATEGGAVAAEAAEVRRSARGRRITQQAPRRTAAIL